MKIPNSDRAIIEPSKLTEYLLNPEHKRGGAKAKLLRKFGYSLENWLIFVIIVVSLFYFFSKIIYYYLIIFVFFYSRYYK